MKQIRWKWKILNIQEVALALRKNKKRPGPTGLTSDMIKFAGVYGLAGLFEALKEVWDSGRFPSEWSESETVSFSKGKGDLIEIGSYRVPNFHLKFSHLKFSKKYLKNDRDN